MASPARVIAAEVLTRVERDGAYASIALETALVSMPGLDPRDAGLASELVHGCLRRQFALDAALERAAERSMSRLEVGVRALLRLGAYQLMYLERVPARAAVHETVELCKARGLSRAAGLANAILRRVARDPTVPLPEDPIARIVIGESHPEWLVRRWVERLGIEEAEALCRVNNTPAPLVLRTNRRRSTREALLETLRTAHPEARVEAGKFSPAAIALLGAGAPSKLPGYAEGLFQVQDEAAQLVGFLVSPAEGSATLDACAAPGGKSCHLAELGGDVLAMDIAVRKLQRLESEARRLGIAVTCVAADAREPAPVPDESQPYVLVDAPCSGLGTLRRHPELRYRRTPDDIPRLADLQAGILRQAARAVSRGGVLVYAVCSSEVEEGEVQRARFLAEHADFRPDPAPRLTPSVTGNVAGEEAGLWSGTEVFVSWPQRHDMDGFSSFRLRRE